jgi:hypothetical protein
MFWMRAYPLRGEVGGGWALEFESFLGPMKWHRADRRVPFRAQKTRGSVSGPRSGSGSFQHQAKKVRKTLILTFCDFFMTFYL